MDKYDDTNSKRCPDCNGKGRRLFFDYGGPAIGLRGVIDFGKCETCGGCGRIDNELYDTLMLPDEEGD